MTIFLISALIVFKRQEAIASIIIIATTIIRIRIITTTTTETTATVATKTYICGQRFLSLHTHCSSRFDARARLHFKIAKGTMGETIYEFHAAKKPGTS